MSSTPKVWLVTGSSSGFGRSMVELLLNKGNKVHLAPKYPTSQLLVVKLDVTHSSDISAAFEEARQTFGKIDVVFNNAGLTQMGEVEGVPEEAARSEAVRFFRDVNIPAGGRLLQVSSQVGLAGLPAVGFYSASFTIRILCPALEGLSECLSKELDPAWNIKITIIEPGPFRTRVMKGLAQHPAYADPRSPSSQIRAGFSPGSDFVDGDADKAVAAMEKLVHLDNPPLRLPLHKWTVAAIKEKIQSVLEEVQAYESWSDDLYNN
ncbi:hypothetical protein BU15DRAFT_88304 [Melanogaster broomeanus]|nr:hypothetical protein BU15DRAFT_88304 [Melanogaster broomeanus]